MDAIEPAEIAIATATWAVSARGAAKESESDEETWQLEHTRELACTCVVLETDPEGTRSRNSLLAS